MPRCKHCKDKFTPRKFNWKYCDKSECMDIGVNELLSKQREKQAKDREAVNNAITEKKKRNTIGYLLNNTKAVFHEYIRLRDKGKPCICCGAQWKPDFHAGHWMKAELYSSIRFNENNVHGQSPQCNIFLNGNHEHYTERIAQRIGEEGKAEVERLARQCKQNAFKWDALELRKTRDYYRKKLNDLKK